MIPQLRYAARSDVGPVRANNQDSAYAGPNLMVVADGMGGHAGGDTASRIAINALRDLDSPEHTPAGALEALEARIEEARRTLVAVSQADPRLQGMGTTITALLRTGSTLVMAHMGDSRAYLLRDGELTQVTVDHTFVQHLVDTGRITPEEAETHPHRNVVMRVLSDFDLDLHPDLSIREARIGDRWLLCSDGLCGFVRFEQLARILSSGVDPAEAADQLVQAARAVPSTDNITAVVIDIVEPEIAPPGLEPESDGVQVVGAAANSQTDIERQAGAIPGGYPAATPWPLKLEGGDAIGFVDDGSAEIVRDLEGEDVGDDPGALDPPQRRGWIAALIAVVVALGLGLGAWQGYEWTQRQYFVGDSAGQVAIFRGIPQNLGPLTLSRPVELTGTFLGELREDFAARVTSTIPADSLEDARYRAGNLIEQGRLLVEEGQ